MKCPKCDADNTDAARFCSNCATSLTGAVEAQPSFTKTLETPLQGLLMLSLLAGGLTGSSRLAQGDHWGAILSGFFLGLAVVLFTILVY